MALVAVVLVSGVPVCPSAGWLGVPCPGCGLTRATLALLSGEPGRALALHPLVFVAAPTLLWLVGSPLLRRLRGHETLEAPVASAGWPRLGTYAAWGGIAALLVVWGLRFLGYFGGPAPVVTYAAWWKAALAPAAAEPRSSSLPDARGTPR